jgi:hypothetical protein
MVPKNLNFAANRKWVRSLILFCAAGSLAFFAWFQFGRQRIDYSKVYRIAFHIAWVVASLILQFWSAPSRIKAVTGSPPVDQGQVPQGGQGIGMFSLT